MYGERYWRSPSFQKIIERGAKMAHTHSLIDADKHFVIDPITRAITNQSEKLVLVQGDYNSEQFTFEIPKTIDGHDMTLCNQVEIHYVNASINKTDQINGIYEVADLAVSAENENTAIFSWLISSNATKYAGKLAFIVKFKCVEADGTISYVWNTAVFEGISVLSGISNTDIVVEEYADILASFEARISEIEKTLQDILDALQQEEITPKTVGDIEQFVISYFENKTIGEVEQQ